MSARLRVVVLGGGPSPEHEVSLASAQAVAAGLRRLGHEVLAVTVSREGRWCHGERPLLLAPGEGLLGADLAFPVLHGPYGEDGTVQGVLEALGLPYVGAGVATSALCVDKIRFKEVVAAYGLPQVRFLALQPVEAEALIEGNAPALQEALGRLGLPLFVKPARMGSSLGIVKVEGWAELPEALSHALSFEGRLIVEEAVVARELECALLGDPEGGEPLIAPPGEIKPKGGWYDFHAKYTPGGMELLVPAPLAPALRRRLEELTATLCGRLGCDHLARVDFFVVGEEVLVNELNTMPGFTPTSVYPKLVEAAGLNYGQLLERLCALALARPRASAREPNTTR